MKERWRIYYIGFSDRLLIGVSGDWLVMQPDGKYTFCKEIVKSRHDSLG
jgi:hypothetical protein